MATLAVQEISKAGLSPSFDAAAAGGDDFISSGKEYVHVKNAHASNPRTVTINSKQNCSQGFDHDLAVVVAALGEALIGPIEKSRFGDAGTGQVDLTYSDSGADLSVAVIRNPV